MCSVCGGGGECGRCVAVSCGCTHTHSTAPAVLVHQFQLCLVHVLSVL